jgi:hypothetical protein
MPHGIHCLKQFLNLFSECLCVVDAYCVLGAITAGIRLHSVAPGGGILQSDFNFGLTSPGKYVF